MKEKKFKKDRLGKINFSTIDKRSHNWDDIDFLDNYIYSSQKVFGLEEDQGRPKKINNFKDLSFY